MAKSLTWLDTKICTGPASAKKPICRVNNTQSLNTKPILAVTSSDTKIITTQLTSTPIRTKQAQAGAGRQVGTHLVHHGDDSLEDLALEGSEDDALVLDGEGDVSRAFSDEPLADVLHTRDRHHEPVPPAARQDRAKPGNPRAISAPPKPSSS